MRSALDCRAVAKIVRLCIQEGDLLAAPAQVVGSRGPVATGTRSQKAHCTSRFTCSRVFGAASTTVLDGVPPVGAACILGGLGTDAQLLPDRASAQAIGSAPARAFAGALASVAAAACPTPEAVVMARCRDARRRVLVAVEEPASRKGSTTRDGAPTTARAPKSGLDTSTW
jgi:hypothetical protein